MNLPNIKNFDIRKKLIKLLFALLIIFVFVGSVSLIFYFMGVFDKVANIHEFSNSFYGYFMYFITYLAIKFSLFIPLSVVIIPFSNVAPAWIAVVIGTVAEVLGSLILYILGFYIGKKVIIWMTDEKTLDKWQTILEKGKYTIFLLLLFPFAPEQIIKILCGSGKMKMRIYLPMILIAQPIGLIATVMVGKSFIYFFEVLPLWLLISLVPIMFGGIGVIMFFSFKYQDKIDQILLGLKKTVTKSNQGKE
ncbi:MAG: VTT domain-containing protein [Candidatus Woesearchaeota archaeon]